MREARSTDPLDYQDLPQPVALMSKTFPSGFEIAPHTHARDQLLYAVSGTMRIRTASDAWIVPPDRALYLPAGVEHGVVMHGPVEMRTLYISPEVDAELPRKPLVLAVSMLLRSLVLALMEEPVVFEPHSRADRMALLVLDEIKCAEPLSLSIPMPQDRRLRRLCDALIAQPDNPASLDAWAEAAGASRRTLARLFQAECGLTFTAWRQRVRFHGAIEALSRGAPVGEVARANGYRSPSAFSAAFRQVVGVSPRALAPPNSVVDNRPEPVMN
jgi:AraC-like DNA-binding protein/quercetin dioxygenase-like cupin family protein